MNGKIIAFWNERPEPWPPVPAGVGKLQTDRDNSLRRSFGTPRGSFVPRDNIQPTHSG